MRQMGIIQKFEFLYAFLIHNIQKIMSGKTIVLIIKIVVWIGLLYLSALFRLQKIFFISSGLYLIFTNLGHRKKGSLSAYSVFNDNFQRLYGTMDGMSLFKGKQQDNAPIVIQKEQNDKQKSSCDLREQYFLIKRVTAGPLQNSRNAVCFPSESDWSNSVQSEQKASDIHRLIIMSYRAKVFLITFFSYVSIHALRTTYSFSKGSIADTVTVRDSQIGIVDSLMLYALALGFFQQTLVPFSRPVLALTFGLMLTAVFYVLIPVCLTSSVGKSFALLCILMSFDGYFQSYVWPNVLMLVNSQFDNKQQAILLGCWSTNTNVGNILGFVICQYLVINNDLPWQFSMLLIGAFVAFNSILVFFFIDELPNESTVIIENIQQSLIEQSDNSTYSDKQNTNSFKNVGKLFRSPTVICLTLAFSLVKSVEYGILLWLPMYFDLRGLVDYSAYIPITFDIASIFSSIALGYAFKRISNKGLLLAPLILVLMILCYLLTVLEAGIAQYFGLIAGVGLCLGGSYNTMSSLVAMQLVKVVDIRYRTKYLGFYSAVLMCVANLITATTQILIGYVIAEDQQLIFILFFWYSAVTLILLVIVALLERVSKQQPTRILESQIEIVKTH